MNMVKIAYKPFGVGLGMAAGAVAGTVFNQVWKRLGHEDDAPDATDEQRHWREILLAAALQGAIFAVVRAAVERGGARTTKRLTGVWPD
ncbi:DUF4235 domain-containing protein [Streptomyces kunmingensis]|uniref:DUF4235 domain-containing protein n=1 Tax=Streptomyces kunmingensis TaxID=68225 RepID=A0ABU6C655_9ACTN|nr:DUF4235 domain-containing protein [Streptomyces kunmingensis]MEB3960203.1 DUF4235 domain-containing protein [Streptomyces kunmingensis]